MSDVFVLVLGDQQVGKSQLLYGEPGLIQPYNATYRIIKKYLFAEYWNFCFLSLSGKWNAEQLPQPYLRKKYDIVYVMFDLTNRASFEKVASYIKAVKRANKKALVLMVATKHDDREHCVVSKAEIKQATKKFGCECIQTSAVNKKNLHELFVKTREFVHEKRAHDKKKRETGFFKRYYKEIILFAVIAALIALALVVAVSFVPGLGPLIAASFVTVPMLASLSMLALLQSAMIVLAFFVLGGITATLILLAKEYLERERDREVNENNAPPVKLSTAGQLAKEAGFVPDGQSDEIMIRADEQMADRERAVEVKEASPSLHEAFKALPRILSSSQGA